MSGTSAPSPPSAPPPAGPAFLPVAVLSEATSAHSRPTRRRGAGRLAILLFVVSLVCYLPGIGAGPLAGTEGHRAITAHQMLASGRGPAGWLLPHLYGRLYLTKPPLHYW